MEVELPILETEKYSIKAKEYLDDKNADKASRKNKSERTVSGWKLVVSDSESGDFIPDEGGYDHADQGYLSRCKCGPCQFVFTRPLDKKAGDCGILQVRWMDYDRS
ncbi:hypothetical protein Gura_3432 [Geotalea uraniireducens Rf4]|uniref:Uncharacterized protein n=1 Tax=Geotalea uraniireducens (strain Rf4) TaxID=351605 RepID=A5G720_GEOUR|nr:hypothetical protein [Geotalea uraniireducens]ABQ27588.1 hypothetical protein Gura_3432 [Geotalea uraniireducens Rf4]